MLGVSLALLLLAGCPPPVRAPAGAPVPMVLHDDKGFCLQEGQGHNCLLRDGTVAAHLVATSGAEPRLVVKLIEQHLANIARAEKTVGPLANSELWTVRLQGNELVPAPYGHGEGHKTESNALQLWSYISLAVALERVKLKLNL